ncbi:hypothetical protein PAXRUDRAFT_796329, partial [Paxillus rubicundulus Ve08.2h10]
PYILCPFTDPEVDNGGNIAEQYHCCKFNNHLSSIHITVKHTFGLLKGCFPILKDLPLEIDIQNTYHLVHALMVMHNICIDVEDHPEDIPEIVFGDDPTFPEDTEGDEDADISNYGAQVVDGPIDIPAWESDEWLRREGEKRPEQILNDIYPL